MGFFRKKTTVKAISIYDFVCENINEEGMYNGASLPDTKPITENPPVYWPLGGKERICQKNGFGESQETADIILSLLFRAMKDTSVRPALYEKAKEKDCIFYYLPLIRALPALKPFDYDAFFQLAAWLAFEGTDREAVKLGMALMMCFKVENIVMKNQSTAFDMLRILGKCPEFTYYMLRIMDTNHMSNDAYFAFAKETTDAGRVFCMDYLKPETKEIREWMLLNGMKDCDYPEDVALSLAEKCGLDEILDEETISRQVYNAVTEILTYLADDSSFTMIEYWPEILLRYFTHSLVYCTDIIKLTTVLSLKDDLMRDGELAYIAEESYDQMLALIDKIERNSDWDRQIYANLCSENRRLSWCARWLAKRYGMDVFEILFDHLQKHPEEDDLYCDLLKETDSKRFGRVLEFAEEHIEEYLTGNYSPMFIIQELKTHPHQGEYILERALHSPAPLHIPACLNVLEAWGPEYISTPIKKALRYALTIERNARSRQRIEKLLVGQVDDGRDFIIRL